MNTPARIKQFLASGRVATVEQLSRALDLTKADIHYHVHQLLARNEISLTPSRRQSGAGRPARQYQLVKPVPIHLSKLIIASLFEENQLLGQNTTRQSDPCEALARAILASCPSFHTKTLSPTVKLNQCVDELAPLGFEIRWQAGKSGPVITVLQEPLSSLIDDPHWVAMILHSLIYQMKNLIA